MGVVFRPQYPIPQILTFGEGNPAAALSSYFTPTICPAHRQSTASIILKLLGHTYFYA